MCHIVGEREAESCKRWKLCAYTTVRSFALRNRKRECQVRGVGSAPPSRVFTSSGLSSLIKTSSHALFLLKMHNF
jgi:hypothetical protein